MEQHIKELREKFAGIEDRLSDREMRIFDIMRYISNSQATDDRALIVENYNRGRGPHLVLSVVATNSRISNEYHILGLEPREVENLKKKLEMWNFIHVPKFQIPFWSLNIYGGPKTNSWEFFGDVYEMEIKDIRKFKFDM